MMRCLALAAAVAAASAADTMLVEFFTTCTADNVCQVADKIATGKVLAYSGTPVTIYAKATGISTVIKSRAAVAADTFLGGAVESSTLSFGTPVTKAGTPVTLTAGGTVDSLDSIVYPIIINGYAAERTVTPVCSGYQEAAVGGTTPALDCAAATPFKFTVGFVPKLSLTQPKLPAVLAAGGFNLGVADIILTAREPTGQLLTSVIAKTITGDGSAALTGAFVYKAQNGEAETAATDGKQFKMVKDATKQAAGATTFTIQAGKFVNEDGFVSAEATIAVNTKAVVALTLDEKDYTSSSVPAALDKDGWFDASSVPTFKITGTGLDNGVYSWDQAALNTAPTPDTAGLFRAALALPGATWSNANGFIATAGTASATEIPFDLDLNGANDKSPTPAGTYRIALPADAIVGVAPAYIDLQIGFPTTFDVQDVNFNSLRDTTVTPAYQTVPVPAGTGADAATLYGVVTVTVPSGQEAYAVAIAEKVGATPVRLSALVDATSTKIAELGTSSFTRVANNTVSIYYKLDLSATAFVAKTTFSIAGGALCGTINDVKICNAVARNVATIIQGTFPTAGTAGTLTLDGKIPVDGSGKPKYDDNTFQYTGDFEFTIGTVAGTASELVVQGPWVDGEFVAGPTLSAGSTAGDAKFTASATTKAGTYIITAPAGKWKAAVPATPAAGNAKVTAMVHVGLHPVFLPGPSGGADDEKLSYQKPQRGLNGPFVTADNDLRLRVFGAAAGSATLPLYDASVTAAADITAGLRGLLKGVYSVADIKARKVNLAPGLSFANDKTTVTTGTGFMDWRVGVSGLADGEYVFVLDTAADLSVRTTTSAELQVRLVIDRKAPEVAPAVYSGPAVFAGLGAAPVAFPGSLVTDAGAPDSAISVTIDSIDKRGFTVTGDSLATGSLVTAYAARYPATNAVLALTLKDDAGNSAKTTYTIPVRQQAGSTVTVVDKRGVQSRTTLYTGSVSSRDGADLPLKVVVDFDEPVYGVTKDSLICTVAGKACAATIVAPTMASADRRYTFDFKVTGSSIPTGSEIIIFVAHTGVFTKNGGLTVKPSAPVTIKVDKEAPSVSNTITFTTTAGAAANFFIPKSACWDSISDNDKLIAASATPSNGNGMVFSRGALGVAALSGTATAYTAAPTAFAVRCLDEAGNEALINVNLVVNARLTESVNSAAVPVDAILSVPTAQMTWTEDSTDTAGTGTATFAGATFAFGTTNIVVSKVIVTLEKPEDDETGPKVEKLTSTSGSGYSAGTDSTLDPNGYASLTATVSNFGGVAAFLQSIKYVNTREGVTSGARTLRVTVIKSGAVVASAIRSLKLTAANDVPAISASGLPVGTTWDEANGNAVSIMGTAVFTDADDTDFTGATLTIATADATINSVGYKGCDKDRDFLYLDPTYDGAHKAAKVTGTWVSSTCQFVLTPLFPATKVSNADLVTALGSIKYKSLDPDAPTGYLAAGASGSALTVKRTFSLTVTDNGSGGRMTTANSVVATAATSNKDKDWQVLTITSVDDKPTVDYAALYAPGGIFYGTDSLAQFKEITVDGKNYKTAKLTIVVPANATTASPATKVSTFKFNLAQDKDKNDAVIKGSYAKGAIKDVDSEALDFGTSNANVALKVKLSAAGLPDSSTAGTALASAPAASVVTAASTFAYLSNADSTLSLTIDRSKVTYTKLGEYEFNLVIGPAPANSDPDMRITIPFYVDIVMEACVDDTATTTKVGTNPSSLTTQPTYVVTALSTSATTAGYYGFSATATAKTTSFYPKNSLCVYLAAPFPPKNGDPGFTDLKADGSLPISRGGFKAKAEAMEAAGKALAASGASEVARVAALAQLRKSAVGAFNVLLPQDSLDGAGSVTLNVAAATPATKDILKGSLGTVDDVQLDVAVKLGPAGTKFSKPVQVCVFAGDTDSGKFKVLAVASQLDPSDESSGYTPFEPLTGQTFDIATGQVCGFTTHFSLFAPIVRNVVTNPTVPKMHLMGGSCPNQCSGHGSCRQDGKCVCFAGFDGYDCSMRSCPAAESWGEDQLTTHSMSECAGRGLCERSSGSCSCFDGFEGPACERMTCPNGCSGHGVCRLLEEMPEVQKVGYSAWEVRRIQVCQCDGGYTGKDCSQRLCPYGDDPETTCWENAKYGVADIKRQVQRVALSFDAPVGGAVSTTTDEFAFQFQTPTGRNFTTQRVEDVWALGANDNLANVLKSLPEFSVKDVTVSVDVNTASKKEFLVTFTGETNTGDMPLLQCLSNTNGLYACTAPGCQPRVQQLRMIDTTAALNSNVRINDYAILESPAPLTGSIPSAEWNVATTLMLRKYEVTLGNEPPVYWYTYEFASTEVWGNDGSATTKKPVVIEETAVPPTGQPTVSGPYGLDMDLLDVDAYITAIYNPVGGPAQLPVSSSGGAQETAYTQRVWTVSNTISWALPTCKVTTETKAESAYESSECSNRGLCNRDSGECECFNGYTGYSCAQQTVYV